MKIFACNQIKKIDAYTIENEPIASIDLMERAANAIFPWIVANYPASKSVMIFSGPGNNGGDGAALGRMLHQVGYDVKVFVIKASRYSNDLSLNLRRLPKVGLRLIYIDSINDFPVIPPNSIVIDSLFGSGLSSPLAGLAADLVCHINSANCQVVSVDIPSGLFGEENPISEKIQAIRANQTLTLQFPKLSFLFAENHPFVGDWHIIDIGLHPHIIQQTETNYYLIDKDLVKSIVKKREKFQHKGNFGHCLIIAGSYGMLGAAILTTKACLRAGAGLVNVHIPRLGYSVLQNSVPEAIVQVDANDLFFTGIPQISSFSSIGIGPGIGREPHTKTGMIDLFKTTKCPLVIDADGLNLIAQSPNLLNSIPKNSILTPHVGEFHRLFGESTGGFDRLMRAIKITREKNIYIIIKGAHSQVVCPNGEVFFNGTGNPGMATAGSGDVLTGIITSFLSQGYNSREASILAVYFHGLAGDMAAQYRGQDSMIASDIIDFLGQAISRSNECHTD